MIARLLAMAAALLAALSVTARAQDLLIQNVRLIDLSAESPQLSAPQSVLIRGDRIAAIAPVGAIPVPEGVTPIDGNGGYLLPGLTDMHVHVWGGLPLPLATWCTAVEPPSLATWCGAVQLLPLGVDRK